MTKLIEGGKLPPFSYDTPFTAGVSIENTVRRVKGKTAVVFLRYYGCTLCQYDIHHYANEYDKIMATGGQLLVVLQSAPNKLAGELKEGELPFDIICDPEQKLYKAFEIMPAASMEEMINEKGKEKLWKVKNSGFEHGDYEGEELQLPAVLVIDSELNINFVNYCQTITEIPETDELALLLG